MKLKKFLIILCTAVMLLLLCVGCDELSEVEKYEQNGYTISVYYDTTGGKVLNQDNTQFMDMFNPSSYQKDGAGTAHIKILNPTSSKRKTGGQSSMSIVKQGYTLCGWYKNRDVKIVDGHAVDESGNTLTLIDGEYYIAGTETKATPCYNFSGYWDFDNDTIDYTVNDTKIELTLYACWIPYFEFDYYKEDGNGGWELLSKTTFDYMVTNSVGSTTSDRDTIWLPKYIDDQGEMEYVTTYKDGNYYKFPKVDGKTFNSAYTDQACQNKITDTLKHNGTLELQTGVVSNNVQNIYIKYDEGERFKIKTAKQLSELAKSDGYYEILNDIDFTDVTWPIAFVNNDFTGKLFSEQGHTYTISNIKVNYSNDSRSKGGLFGSIEKGAEITNVIFENTIVSITYTRSRLQNAMFGLFAGNISSEASISGVTIKDGSLKMGALSWMDGYQLNLVANGNRNSITLVDGDSDGYSIKFYISGGTKLKDEYDYKIDKDDVTIDKDLDVTIKFASNRYQNAEYQIYYLDN